MKLDNFEGFSSQIDVPGLRRICAIFAKNLNVLINGNLSFADNFKGQTLTAEFTVANSDTLIAHQLSTTPRGYIVVGSSTATIVYDGSNGTFNQTFLRLRASAPGLVRIFVY